MPAYDYYSPAGGYACGAFLEIFSDAFSNACALLEIFSDAFQMRRV